MKFPLLILFSVVASFANGQTDSVPERNKFDIGFEGSPSLIFLTGSGVNKDYNKSTIGFAGGFFFQYNFPKTFSIRTNISFERKGEITTGKISLYDFLGNNIGSATWYDRDNYGYLSMPLLFRVTFGKKINYFINGGPFFSYLISRTSTLKYSSTYPKSTNKDYPLDRRFDAGASLGFGISISIKKQFLISCEIRNNSGLYNICDVPSYTIKSNSTNLLISFAYMSGIKKAEAK